MDIKKLQKNYGKISEYIDYVIMVDDFKEAYKIYSELNDLGIKKKDIENNEFLQEVDKAMKKLKWIALPFFSKSEVLSMFNNDFSAVFELVDFDLWAKMKHFLLDISLMEERDKFKSRVLDVLNRNQTIMTTKKLENDKLPTMENWIKYYTSVLGNGSVDIMKFRQFFVANKEIKKLSRIEKKLIESFFKFYEHLKLSSSTVAGFEGVVPVNTPDFKGFIRDGRLEKEGKLDYKMQGVLDLVLGKNVASVKGPLGVPKTPEEKNIDILKEEGEKYEEGGLERMMLNEEIDSEKKVEDLKIDAKKYAEGSLERMVMEEEIRKMED